MVEGGEKHGLDGEMRETKACFW